MNKVKIVFLLISMILLIVSCDYLDELADVDLPVDFDIDYAINIDDENQQISMVRTYDLTDNVSDYKNN